jgi:hypothetical protein
LEFGCFLEVDLKGGDKGMKGENYSKENHRSGEVKSEEWN